MRRFAALMALVALAACSRTAELDELTSQLHRLERQVVDDQALASNILQDRRRQEELAQLLARAGLDRPVDERAGLLLDRTRNELGSGAAFESTLEADGTRRVTFTAGKLPDDLLLVAMRSTAELSPWAVLEAFSRTPTGVTVSLAVRPASACAPPAANPPTFPKPPPRQILSNPNRRRALVERIDGYERELRALSKIIGEGRRLEAANDCDEQLLATVHAPDHLAAALPILDAAFGPDSPAKDATLELDPKRLRLDASPKDGRSYDAIREAFTRFGTLSKIQQNEASLTLVVDRRP